MRFILDLIALILHVGSLFFLFFYEISPWLIAMQSTTILFHIYYVLPVGRGTWGVPRVEKWYEYGISATLGTIAVLDTSKWELIVLFALMGNAQQLQGIILERNWNYESFTSGALLQLAEFIYVGSRRLDTVYFVYVAFYSIFGVLAYIRIQKADVSEELYSLFGFVAKLALFYSELFPVWWIYVIVWVLLILVSVGIYSRKQKPGVTPIPQRVRMDI